MQSILFPILAVGLALCSPASAVYSYSTLSSCTTRYGPQSTSVKSTGLSLTVSVTYTQKSTTTRGVTITPSPTTVFATNTITNTVVTTLSPTNTITTTSSATMTNTVLTTATVTSTFSTTVSSTPPTSTVPTVAGFTPLYSASDYVAKRELSMTSIPAIRGRLIEARATSSVQASPSAQGRVRVYKASGAIAFSPSQYPTQIICGTLVEAISTTTQVLTASTITTTTLPPATNTITTAVTTTTTSTSTLAPVTASTTITTTVTTSLTLTATQVTSVTTTDVIVGPTPTAYAACQSNNAVNSANGGHGISGLTHTSNSYFLNVSPQSLDTCCGTCQSIGGCQGYIYFSGDSTCFLIIGNTCDATQNFGDTYNTSPSLSISNVVGNGPCGQLLNQGDIGSL